MGILPELPERIRDKKLKYKILAERGLEALDAILMDKGIKNENNC